LLQTQNNSYINKQLFITRENGIRLHGEVRLLWVLLHVWKLTCFILQRT